MNCACCEKTAQNIAFHVTQVKGIIMCFSMDKAQTRHTFTFDVSHSCRQENIEGGIFKTNMVAAVEGQKWQERNCCQTRYKEL